MLAPNDIMEELSLVYVRAVASRAGFSVEEVRRDRDSIDLNVCARGPLDGGPLESPMLGVQLKSTSRDLSEHDAMIPFDLKVKNYNDLTRTSLVPRILVVLLLPRDPQQWMTWSEETLVLRRCAYWLSLKGRSTTKNEATERVHLPRAQVFDPPCIRRLLEKVARQEPVTP